MSYATYVSATIHVRIAAQREKRSEAHACLLTCLEMLKANEDTNWAIRKASLVIRNLMTRMRVEVEHAPITRSESDRGEVTTNPQMDDYGAVLQNAGPDGFPDLDIEQIIQSFLQDQQGMPQHIPTGGGGHGISAYGSPNAQQYHSAYHPHRSASRAGSTLSTEYNNGYNDQYASQTANDMLFGFNGSTLDFTGLSGL